MAKKFGRSLSFCVKDVIDGIVNIDDIELIVSSTIARNDRQFEIIINKYAKTYWSDNPIQAINIAWKLWNSGKIVQPRLMNNNFYQNLVWNSNWADSEESAYNSIFNKYTGR